MAEGVRVNEGTGPIIDADEFVDPEDGLTKQRQKVRVENLPGSYPLPSSTVTTLTPQKDALTDAQLRAQDVKVTLDGEQVQTRLLSGSTLVDATHPLPVTGSFSDANGVPYDANNPLPVDVGGSITLENLTVGFESKISTANSTQTPLGANESFVGTWEEVTDYAAIIVGYYTDQDSAPFGAGIEFSIDGANALPPPVSQYASVPANVAAYTQIQPNARYFRVTYTNGPVAQTFLSSQVILAFQPNATTQGILAAPATDSTVNDQVKAHVAAKLDSGAYLPLRATDDLELRVNDEASGEYLANRYGGGKKAFAAQVSATGTIVTPAAGKKLRVYWVYAVANPALDASPLITFTLGADAIYAGFALSHWEVFEGAIDAPLTITLSEATPVAVTVHYEEI